MKTYLLSQHKLKRAWAIQKTSARLSTKQLCPLCASHESQNRFFSKIYFPKLSQATPDIQNIDIDIDRYVCIYMCVHIYIHVYIYVCVHVCIYIKLFLSPLQ